MNRDKQSRAWDELLRAAKSDRGSPADPAAEQAPESFVTRVRTMRAGLWAVAKAIFWRRWSLVAIVVAALVYLCVEFFLPPRDDQSIQPPKPPTPLAP